MSLELRHLRCLVAIVDSGTFTDAAIDLGISQAAVSRPWSRWRRYSARGCCAAPPGGHPDHGRASGSWHTPGPAGRGRRPGGRGHHRPHPAAPRPRLVGHGPPHRGVPAPLGGPVPRRRAAAGADQLRHRRAGRGRLRSRGGAHRARPAPLRRAPSWATNGATARWPPTTPGPGAGPCAGRDQPRTLLIDRRTGTTTPDLWPRRRPARVEHTRTSTTGSPLSLPAAASASPPRRR